MTTVRPREKECKARYVMTPWQVEFQKHWRDKVIERLRLSCSQSSQIIVGQKFTIIEWYDSDKNIFFREIAEKTTGRVYQ